MASKGTYLPTRPARGSTTEQKILSAARREFSEKGLDGARMQAIADAAGTNKALLHYYFRSKENLFESSIRDIISNLWADVHRRLNAARSETNLRALIHAIVSAYITTFAEQPDLPKMLIREIASASPVFLNVIGDVFATFKIVPETIFSVYYRCLKRGEIRRHAPLHFMMNLMGMCAATFLVKPVVENLSRKTGQAIEYTPGFYKNRIAAITEMACDGIFIRKENIRKKKDAHETGYNAH
jgi:TetR/AcrR family transcriptional regulator